MSVVGINLNARWGNAIGKYCYARGYAEKHGCQLQTSPWIGQKIFQIDESPLNWGLPPRYDMDLEQWEGDTDIELTGWGLHQKTLLYSRADAKRWLKFRPEVQARLDGHKTYPICAHLRHGDFVIMDGYVAVSSESLKEAFNKFGFNPDGVEIVSEQIPHLFPGLEDIGGLWLLDFYILSKANVLFRSNSTFSYWAAVLGNAERVFAPKLDGIKPIAGVIQDAPFVEGNWPAISCVHPNCSDLHLRET